MYEEIIINFVVLAFVMVLNLILMFKVRVPAVNIVAGLLLVIMAWGIGTLPASPWLPLMATFFGIFTVAEATRDVMY